MDAHRLLFALTIAATLTAPALAAPPSESAPVRYTNEWSGAPTSAPTISATGNTRNPYPQQPTTRAQTTAISASAPAPQSYAAPGYVAQPSNNPFATAQSPVQPAPAAPRVNSNMGSPWTTSATGGSAPAAATAPNWGSPAPVTPAERSVLASSPASPPTSDWTSIGTSIAAPPMLLPTSTPQMTTLTPLNTTSSFDSGPALTTNGYNGVQPGFGTSQNSSNTIPPNQSAFPTNTQSASASNSWGDSWSGNSSSTSASIGSASSSNPFNNNSLRSGQPRETDFPNSSRVAAAAPDSRRATDSWIDESLSRNAQPSRPGTIGSATTSAPSIQSPTNAPPLNPPVMGSIGNNPNFNSQNPNVQSPWTTQQSPQQPMSVNVSKPLQTANGEPQGWATLLIAILALAGSIAGNVYLGWSYMDARQKYQALVRRTAETFRRTKVAA